MRRWCLKQLEQQRSGQSRRQMAILALVDEGTGYTMTGDDGWRAMSLDADYFLRCDACHAEGGPSLQETGMLCVDGPQVGRFLCGRHYDALDGRPEDNRGLPDPFRES